MTEKDLRSALREEASGIDVCEAPAGAIVADGRSRRRTRRLTTLAGALTVVAAVGLGAAALPEDHSAPDPAGRTADDSSRCDPDARVEVDGSVVRGPNSYDYDRQDSLGEALTIAQVALSGRILGWEEGRILDHGDIVQSFALLAVRVEESVGGVDAGDVAYVDLSRGIALTDAPPRGESTQRSIQDLRRAAPECARVIVLGDPVDGLEESGTVVETSDEVLPPGTVVIAPLLQGLILETADGGFDSGIADPADLDAWGERSSPDGFAALVDELVRIDGE